MVGRVETARWVMNRVGKCKRAELRVVISLRMAADYCLVLDYPALPCQHERS